MSAPRFQEATSSCEASNRSAPGTPSSAPRPPASASVVHTELSTARTGVRPSSRRDSKARSRRRPSITSTDPFGVWTNQVWVLKLREKVMPSSNGRGPGHLKAGASISEGDVGQFAQMQASRHVATLPPPAPEQNPQPTVVFPENSPGVQFVVQGWPATQA